MMRLAGCVSNISPPGVVLMRDDVPFQVVPRGVSLRRLLPSLQRHRKPRSCLSSLSLMSRPRAARAKGRLHGEPGGTIKPNAWPTFSEVLRSVA